MILYAEDVFKIKLVFMFAIYVNIHILMRTQNVVKKE